MRIASRFARYALLTCILWAHPGYGDVTPPLIPVPGAAPPIVQLPAPTTGDRQISPIAPPSTVPTPSQPLPSAIVNPPGTPGPTTTVTSGPDATIGQEKPGGKFTISSPNGLIYDLENGITVARGPVTLTYRELTVKADRGTVDYNTNVATLAGNLTVTVQDQVYYGKTLVYNLDTGKWALQHLNKTYPPEFFPPGTVLEPVYMKGEVYGQEDVFKGKNLTFSSCDRGHYWLESKRIDFYRDKSDQPDRIVLRDNALYIFKQKIIPLPVYVISLKADSSRRVGLQTSFGQDAQNGYFVKTLYDIDANANHTDTLLTDFFQNRGLGLGLQRELASGAGLFYLYALSGLKGSGREVDSRINRTWKLSKELTTQLTFTSSANNAIAGAPVTSKNGNLTFNFNTPTDQSNLLLRYDSTDSASGNSSDYSASLDNRLTLNHGFTFTSNSLYAENQFFGVGTTETLDNTFSLERDGDTFNTYLRTELHNALTGLPTYDDAYQLERLPELAVSTDTTKFRKEFNDIYTKLLDRYFPGDINITFGDYIEPATKRDVSRVDFLYRLRPDKHTLIKKKNFESSITTLGQFQQDFYSDDTARYNYSYGLGFDNTLGRWELQSNFLKQQYYGFTPFLFDFVGPGETIDATLSYKQGDKVQFNLSTGKDILNDINRDVVASIQYKPVKSFYVSLGTSYSSFSSSLGDIITNFHLSRDPDRILGGSLDVGIRYTPNPGYISQFNAQTDIRLTHGLKMQALVGYTGFTGTFDFLQVRLVQDLHCVQLYVTYDQTIKELRFDLALKAFPFVDSRFGMGQLGQGFSPTVGGIN